MYGDLDSNSIHEVEDVFDSFASSTSTSTSTSPLIVTSTTPPDPSFSYIEGGSHELFIPSCSIILDNSMHVDGEADGSVRLAYSSR